MTNCRHHANRIVPVSYNKNEDFKDINLHYFFLCHIISGYTVLLINGEKVYLTANMLLSFPRNTKIEPLASYNLKAHSVSFAPEFININLTWESIESKDYPLLSKELNYPCFDLFYQRNLLYNGILPLETPLNDKITICFADILKQIEEQPDKMWSCRTRSALYTLFDVAEYFCHEFMKGERRDTALESEVLDYIHLHLCQPLSIKGLCDLFHTNHTTICRKFKALTGCSIADYIIEKRLLLAKHALAFTFLPVGEIAKKCGFHDASYFTRTFNKRVGLSPAKYRELMRAKRTFNYQ